LALTIQFVPFVSAEDTKATIETLDSILGFAEFFLVPASILWLVAAWRDPKSRGLRAPTVLALILALTVAQPFGVVASKEAGAPPPTEAGPNGESVHVARLFGFLPVLPFRLYQREIFLSGLGENAPNETLRARSWFWLPLLTNATQVAETCSDDVLTPCWKPGYSSEQNLTVLREGGTHLATIDNPPGRGEAQIPDSFTWKLRAGIASPAGLAYWVLAGFLVIMTRRRRSQSSSPT